MERYYACIEIFLIIIIIVKPMEFDNFFNLKNIFEFKKICWEQK